MKVKKAIASGGAVAILAASGILASAPSASATVDCNLNWFCLYYNSRLHGAWYGTLTNEPNLDRYTFEAMGESAGHRKPVKNNAGSAWNRSTHAVRVYFNSGYRGAYDVVPARDDPKGDPVSDLPKTKNNNASILWMQ
ncbi:peptidase inhibitor family I36 protein [Streptomyces sp. NPDC018045]|uniref:peptidase inhibitor family I36 protein n=1 Tax=Streptomyces sp. NPDC018045 TaxID=3365037 RepID=UPI00379D91EB